MKWTILALTLVGVVSAASAQSLRAQTEKFDKLVSACMKKKDFKALAEIMRAGVTPHFTYVENGRTENFDAMFQGMKRGLSAMKRLTVCEAKTLEIKDRGDHATGITRHTMAGTTIGPDKKPHKLNFVGISTDTYVNVGGEWKMAKMVMKTTTMTMDGKPMNPGRM